MLSISVPACWGDQQVYRKRQQKAKCLFSLREFQGHILRHAWLSPTNCKWHGYKLLDLNCNWCSTMFLLRVLFLASKVRIPDIMDLKKYTIATCLFVLSSADTLKLKIQLLISIFLSFDGMDTSSEILKSSTDDSSPFLPSETHIQEYQNWQPVPSCLFSAPPSMARIPDSKLRKSTQMFVCSSGLS